MDDKKTFHEFEINLLNKLMCTQLKKTILNCETVAAVISSMLISKRTRKKKRKKKNDC